MRFQLYDFFVQFKNHAVLVVRKNCTTESLYRFADATKLRFHEIS